MKAIDKLNQAIADDRKLFSFEYFPPKTEAGVLNLYERIERMALLEPAFVDFTWGAGGSTSDLTLELSSNAQNFCGLEVMMHLTCTNLPKDQVHEALEKAKAAGIQNILALRGDPPRGVEAWEACEGGFAHAIDLVKYIRAEYGDYFGICVAGYPEGHIEASSLEDDLQYLKDKVDAGADFVITQLFFDTDLFLDFVDRARAIGIHCPIIPGIMPIQNYNSFHRMTSFCKSSVPDKVWRALEPIKSNDAQVKEFGVEYGIQMCRRLLDAGAPAVHLYTLNLERSAKLILQGLNLIRITKEKRLPWRTSETFRRESEDVRPIFWANRPKSYLQRTISWDEFPNGRWGDARSPAFGDLSDYHLCMVTPAKAKDRRALWGEHPRSLEDIYSVFAGFVMGEVASLPWCENAVQLETVQIAERLRDLNLGGFLTINSQPRVNGAPSTDPAVGWGAPGGYVYQKAYLEMFMSPEKVKALISTAPEFKQITYHAVNAKGHSLSNAGCNKGANAVTWGVMPNSEVLQPTVVDPLSFMVWKDEAFGLWLSDWASIYPKGSESAALLHRIYNSFYLVNIVDNDYVHGDIFDFVNRVVAVDASASETLEKDKPAATTTEKARISSDRDGEIEA